jgi:hypothetical protein
VGPDGPALTVSFFPIADDEEVPSILLFADLVDAMCEGSNADLDAMIAEHAEEIAGAFSYWRGVRGEERLDATPRARSLVDFASRYEAVLGSRYLFDELGGPPPANQGRRIGAAPDAEIEAYIAAHRQLATRRPLGSARARSTR